MPEFWGWLVGKAQRFPVGYHPMGYHPMGTIWQLSIIY